MVDFNNEATIGRPAKDVEEIIILERRYNFIEALEDYKKKKFSNIGVSFGIVRARLLSLFLQFQATIKRRWADDYEDMLKTCLESKDEQKILDVFFQINEYLDELKITRIDNQRVYNAQNPEEENKVKGF